MIYSFITVRIIDIVDILLVAFLMYQVYILIKGTIATYIFVTIISIYILWLLLVKDRMILLGSILSQIVSVGVIALIVVFQPELRRFLVIIGTRYFSKTRLSLSNFFIFTGSGRTEIYINAIVKACINMAKKRIGALIVLKRKTPLNIYEQTGEIINADTSSSLLESIFNKESPLHDGAVTIIDNKIHAARCVLPVSDNFNLPPSYGMRHRAGIGLTEETDALVIIISEETGEISLAEAGRVKRVDPKILFRTLEKEFLYDY
jgi:diadenylate cyclase